MITSLKRARNWACGISGEDSQCAPPDTTESLPCSDINAGQGSLGVTQLIGTLDTDGRSTFISLSRVLPCSEVFNNRELYGDRVPHERGVEPSQPDLRHRNHDPEARVL